MKNNIKTFLITGFVAVVVVIVGVALMNSNKTSEQKQEAAVTSNSLVGKPMPNVRLMDKDGKAYPMESLRGKNAVLFFNEGLMCYDKQGVVREIFDDPNMGNNNEAILQKISKF